MPPRRDKKKPSPPKPTQVFKKEYIYAGSLKPNSIDGELYWADDRAKSSSQFTARYLSEDKKADGARSASPTGHAKSLSSRLKDHGDEPENKMGYITEPTHGPASKLHSVMTSAQPRMDHDVQEEYYKRTYPFNYLQLKDLKDTTASVERVYKIQQITGAEESKTMESIILSLRYLEDTEKQNLKNCLFFDLMGFGAESVLYASAFGFERLITLELSERSKSDAIRFIRQVPGLYERCTVLVGSFHDYFPCDAQVYYMDCGRVIDRRRMGDEGVLVNKIFALFGTLLPGAFLILLTNMTHFDVTDDFKAPWMKILLKATVHHGYPDEATLWIFGVEFK